MSVLFSGVVDGPEELKEIYRKLYPQFPQRAVFLMSGPMGVGKTETIKALTSLLGLRNIASPSFAIHHHYEGGGYVIDHLDLFRLEDEDDLESTGFWDLFSQTKAWIFIEWADRLEKEYLPLNWPQYEIVMKMIEGNRRHLEIIRN